MSAHMTANLAGGTFIEKMKWINSPGIPGFSRGEIQDPCAEE
jgi:hypothetical protein